MLEVTLLAAIAGTFLLAGAIKGVIGLGLPSVSLGLLTAAIDLPTAMALLLVPSFVTNFWQAIVGGNGKVILARIWPFLLTATVTVWLGGLALTTVNPSVLSGLLGVLLFAYGALNLVGVRVALRPRQEFWSGPVFGAANGILTGMTGSFVVPGVMFLQAIGLPRDLLIQAMGMLFTTSTVALALALQSNNLLSPKLGMLSAVAVIPAIAGMFLGQMIRQHLSEAIFRRVFFTALLVLGAYIVGNAISGFK